MCLLEEMFICFVDPRSVRVPTHEFDHKCLGEKAIYVFIEALSLNGPLVELHHGEDGSSMVRHRCILKTSQCHIQHDTHILLFRKIALANLDTAKRRTLLTSV
eukprot:Blabericola_migrator_1__5462@NODE_2791_length_2349_cov_7_387818_g1750_i0_p1_GENE_NODE_2791_length_2349_cov_7_387818_g1750_i0NODE_2791_length_2349_cov_7_387818_g1750_i0_p1_ORF_typecomplete_len103_score5_39_NODE_2791_length_2349_cov_7_387818_g1750_i017732081